MITIIQDGDDLKSIRDDWNALAIRFGTPLLLHEWFEACAKSFYAQGQLRIVAVHSQGKIKAIAPLVMTRVCGVKRLAILGTDFHGEPSGLLYDKNAESLTQLIRAILSLGTAAILSRIQLDPSEVSTFQETCQKSGLFLLRNTASSPWLPITSSWDCFEASLSARRRSDLRRAQRRAHEMGQVDTEIFAPGVNGLDRYLDEVFQVEASSWKGRQKTAVLLNAAYKNFFSTYSRALAARGMLNVAFLRIDRRPVAAQLGLEYANRYWVLKIGYDEAFSSCSPGILLMHETIKHAFAKGLEAYEFLGTDQPWIHLWKIQCRPYDVARIYPYSANGLLSFGIDCSRFLSAKALGKFRRAK